MYKKIILTNREMEIIDLIKDSPTLIELSDRLGISYRTLQWHLSRLYAKFRVKNKFELILTLIELKPDYLVR